MPDGKPIVLVCTGCTKLLHLYKIESHDVNSAQFLIALTLPPGIEVEMKISLRETMAGILLMALCRLLLFRKIFDAYQMQRTVIPATIKTA
ncbi:MAG: hypothetical protein ACOH2K_17005 [Burkholderiaceae bacterium]